MKSLLQAAGVPEDRILTDPESNDTLTSIIRCANILKGRKQVDSVVVCTDRYHLPRCRWLFWLLGVPTSKRPMPGGLGANGIWRWAYYYAREILAIPWDTVLLTGRRVLQ